MKENEILVCACHSTEHQIVIQKDEEDNLLYCSIHLSPLPWYERLINGIKYIFGYRCCYGDFDEFVFNQSHIQYLKEMIKFLEPEKSLGFSLNSSEFKEYFKFVEEHKGCKSSATIGGKISVIFTLSGLGTIKSIKCNTCGEEKEITDVSNW